MGDQILNDGLAKLNRLNLELNVNNDVMNVANEQLAEDNERLLEIGEKIKTTMGVLKEAGKYITHIAKSYYKDKCLVGVSILILLLIVTVVIVGVVKNQKASAAASAAAASLNGTSSTNTTHTTNTTTTNTTALKMIYFRKKPAFRKRKLKEYQWRQNALHSISNYS